MNQDYYKSGYRKQTDVGDIPIGVQNYVGKMVWNGYTKYMVL